MALSCKRPALAGAGRNSNSGFSPTTIFRIPPPKMFEMLSRVIFFVTLEKGASSIWFRRHNGK
jgi:hypothetical protein